MNSLDTLLLCGYAIGYLLTVWFLIYYWVYRWKEEDFSSEDQALGFAFMAAVLWPLIVGALIFIGTIMLITYFLQPLVKIFLIPINPK